MLRNFKKNGKGKNFLTTNWRENGIKIEIFLTAQDMVLILWGKKKRNIL